MKENSKMTDSAELNPTMMWVDTETTGLLPDAELMQLAIVLTDDDLNEIDSIELTREFSIKVRAALDREPEAKKMHMESGLVDSAMRSTMTLDRLEVLSRRFLSENGATPDGRLLLAGSTIAFDRTVLARSVPTLLDYVGHRNFDVSVYVEASRRWGDGEPDVPKSEHTALSDIRRSLEIGRLFRVAVKRSVICSSCEEDAQVAVHDARPHSRVRQVRLHRDAVVSTHPYTDKQVEIVRKCRQTTTASQMLDKFHDAGITLMFPKPPPLPFYVRYDPTISAVFDRRTGTWVSQFCGDDRDHAAELDCGRRIGEVLS